MAVSGRLFGEVEQRERKDRIVRLAWARAEAARQMVYRNCLRLASRAPEEIRQSVAEGYLSDVISAISEVGRD